MLQKHFFFFFSPPVVEGSSASEKERLIPLIHRVNTHFLIVGSESVFCRLQNLLSSSILSGVDVSFFCHLSPCFSLRHVSSSRSFIIRSAVHLNTYAMFSLLRLFVYFCSPSLFLSPHLPGRNFYAPQCCTPCERACCFRHKFPRSFMHTGCFYLQ